MPTPPKPRLRPATIAVALLALTTAVPGIATGAARAPFKAGSAALLVTKRVATPGEYAVLVSLPGTKTAVQVNVSIGSQQQDAVPLGPGAGQELAFFINVPKSRRFTVRTVSTGARVRPTVSSATEAAAVAGATPTSGAYRNLAFAGSFAGAAGSPPNASQWETTDTSGGCGAGTLSTNTPNAANVSLDGSGNLAITALAGPGQTYTSAQIDSNGLYSYTYGRLEARLELPAGAGLCSALWLLQNTPAGTSCTASCGEIDVVEQIGPEPDVAWADLHGPVTGSANYQQWQSHVTAATPLTGSFHTYGLIWSPNRLTWTLDGLPYATATPSSLPKSATWVFNGTPFHIIGDLAVGGWPGPPASSAEFPATLRIAWVRVFQ